MIKMNEEELKITNEDIELLKEMKENCLKADVYDDEKRLLKANAITKFLKLQNNWNELKKLIDERIGDCRYFLTNADINYEKENMKKFMWLKEELQVLKSKAQELEQGKDE